MIKKKQKQKKRKRNRWSRGEKRKKTQKILLYYG